MAGLSMRLTREGRNQRRKPCKHRSIGAGLRKYSIQDRSANPALRGLKPRKIESAGFKTPQPSAKPRRNDHATLQVNLGVAGFAGFAGLSLARAHGNVR